MLVTLLLLACNGPKTAPGPEPVRDGCDGLDPAECWTSDACLLDQSPDAQLCRAPDNDCERAFVSGAGCPDGCVHQQFPCFCPPDVTCACGGGAPPRCLPGPPAGQRTWVQRGDVYAGLADDPLEVVVLLRGKDRYDYLWVVPLTETGARGTAIGDWDIHPGDPAPALEQADKAFAADSAERGGAAWRDAFAADGMTWSESGFVRGADAIGERMGGAYEGGLSLAWEPSASAMYPSGSLGVTVGPYTATSGDDVEQGVYVTVWRKQADDSWAAVLDFSAR